MYISKELVIFIILILLLSPILEPLSKKLFTSLLMLGFKMFEKMPYLVPAIVLAFSFMFFGVIIWLVSAYVGDPGLTLSQSFFTSGFLVILLSIVEISKRKIAKH